MLQNITMTNFRQNSLEYLVKLSQIFDAEALGNIEKLAFSLKEAWASRNTVYLCGNGGSAANAIHIANDLHYGVGVCKSGSVMPGLRVEALCANTAVVTCLGNDCGYENIFSKQLLGKVRSDDILIVLSGSGNSTNVIRALEAAAEEKMKSFAVVGYNGGICKSLADVTIHLAIDDMQIVEDAQLIVGHLCMKWLSENRPDRT